jgi:hypothetical protein
MDCVPSVVAYSLSRIKQEEPEPMPIMSTVFRLSHEEFYVAIAI